MVSRESLRKDISKLQKAAVKLNYMYTNDDREAACDSVTDIAIGGRTFGSMKHQVSERSQVRRSEWGIGLGLGLESTFRVGVPTRG